MAMVEPIFSASSRSWLTKTIVLPRRCWSSSSSSWSSDPDQRIQRREGLVHQQDVGIGSQRPRQPHPLLHAARELVHPLAGPRIEMDEGELLLDDAVALGPRDAPNLETEAHILGDGAPGQ